MVISWALKQKTQIMFLKFYGLSPDFVPINMSLVGALGSLGVPSNPSPPRQRREVGPNLEGILAINAAQSGDEFYNSWIGYAIIYLGNINPYNCWI